MVDMGLSVVRIGEFAWARLEPEDGVYDLSWMHRAIDTLAEFGLEICLATPTACPPKWLVDRSPDILGVGADGIVKRFGSRRHYCFSSPTYRAEATRITAVVAEAFGQHPAVKYWQTDNEFGHHDTTRSYSPAARDAFRLWLQARYGSIDALNRAWGTLFWSQVYQDFEAIDLPNLTVTEPNPSHVLDFYRFSSDQIATFNRLQTDILRQHSPGREVTHNFIGDFRDFDAFALGRDLDFASWDSYPLGFLAMGPFSDAEKAHLRRQGHPDFTAFHHDLYRNVGNGRLWIMEQQPGPVNWAPHNPAPLEGMVKSWSLEAFGHGAECVSYFRWRQFPAAQEQMHAGLLRVDGEDAPGAREVREASAVVAGHMSAPVRTPVALVFSYEADWVFDIQPQGEAWSYFEVVLDWYRALRRAGYMVDIKAPGDRLDGYAAVFIPSLPIVSDAALAAIMSSSAQIVIGPRSGSKTESFQIPAALPPGPLSDVSGLRVTHSESLPRGHSETAQWQERRFTCRAWLDHCTGDEPLARTQDGVGVYYRKGRIHTLASLPCDAFMDYLIADISQEIGLRSTALPPSVRLSETEALQTLINYALEAVDLPDAASGQSDTLHLPPGGSILFQKTEA